MRIQSRVVQAALTLAAGLTALRAAPDLSGPQMVLPVRLTEGTLSQHGDWKFNYRPSSNMGDDDSFFQPSFDVDAWNTIPVPSHWELHGFAERRPLAEEEAGSWLSKHFTYWYLEREGLGRVLQNGDL